MALGTGSIRFSEIVAEFGGVSPHRFSEYYALNALGVSGIPASGLMRFTHFRGKSNQVTEDVWVSSGYNHSEWVSRGVQPYYWTTTSNGTRYPTGWVYVDSDNWGKRLEGIVNGTQTTLFNNIAARFQEYYLYSGNNRYIGSSYLWTNNKGTQKRYKVVRHEYVTSWIDTSSWVTQTRTAKITT